MKKICLLLGMSMCLLFLGVGQAAAAVNPSIQINGEERQFDPSCQIVNNRTMVPLRFIMEDPAFQGKVSWNGKLQRVTVDFTNKIFTFAIGDTKVLVDGNVSYLDAAPYIYQDRTFIPIRFFAEQMGARVSWNATLKEVKVEFDPEIQVFAYYYYHGFDELKENADLMTDVAFRWFKTSSKGELSYEYKDQYQEILNFTRAKGIKTHASVVLMGQDALHSLLSNPANRFRLVENIDKELRTNGYDGINIDFEFLYPDDAGNLTLFLKELKNKIGEDKILSIAVFARTADDHWETGFDYKTIGEIADKVVVMAYDYHYATNPPGPVAPLWWVEEVIDYTTSIMPREKILLGMPTYGYDWAKGEDGKTVTASKLDAVISQYGATERFDWESMSPSYHYTDDRGIKHEIWMENEKSLTEKWKAADENSLAGISFWRIGTGFDDLYDVIENNL
ncbi:MAG: glycosyl hydrolase family 18 protein [Bacillota bacterium]|nr:glycosyl hydrolase family 18 protein [Bacillota bacterium]